MEIELEPETLGTAGKVLERRNRRRQVIDSLDIGGAGRRLRAGLPQVMDGPVPGFTAVGVVGESLDVFGKATGPNRLDRSDNLCVQLPSPFVEQACVGYLVGQRVPERVLQIREEASVVSLK